MNPANDIAVIGMACRFPGARHAGELWRNLAEGRVSLGEVPAGRWRWQDHAADLPEDSREAARWGGFLDDPDTFDREFFGLSAREAAPMDPQQRMALELAWACFESAGLRPSRHAGERVGVFVGIANLDYKEIVEAGGSIDAHYATGIGASVLANRLSYVFDWRGPSVSIDTACSSSLFAIHAAARALRDDECNLALVGGISLLLTPRRFVCFGKARMLSPTGRIRSFDDSADGMVRGEGGGLILLKPLARALEDGNSILGVVKGTATNHSGRTRSITYPSAAAQADVIRRAHEAAGFVAGEVSYIEAHGTGTPKGDPIEIEGLLEAFRFHAPGLEPCGLGSLKPNLGHLEAAAGIAGVIKVLLAMRHKALPPLANFRTLNSRASLDGTRFRIVDRLQSWEPRIGRRIAGVSSFGFAGTNAHVVLEEGPPITRRVSANGEPHVLCLSAKTPAALARRKSEMIDWLGGEGRDYELAAICAAALHGREHFAMRAAAVGRTHEEVIAGLLVEDTAPAAPARDYIGGADPDSWGLYPGAPAALATMPHYPFEKIRCWVRPPAGAAGIDVPVDVPDGTPSSIVAKPSGIVLRPLAEQDSGRDAQNEFRDAQGDVPETITQAIGGPSTEPSLDELLEQIYIGKAGIEQVLDRIE